MVLALGVLAMILGAATAVNFSLTFAVIRRLGEIEARPSGGTDPLPALGTAVANFTATTVDGRRIDQSDIARGDTVMGFLMVGCGPCAKLIEASTRAPPPTRSGALFFVLGDPAAQAAQEMAANLGRHGDVVVVADQSVPSEAFGGIVSFPTLLTELLSSWVFPGQEGGDGGDGSADAVGRASGPS
ncbi:hypothetical protein, partial [Kitasatospora sp. NPDC051914]|uniref:hypothetical protein n=1 Tax=Kitasatospora sp. NPDC051914 TaxID=3154945 RepID=UPI00342848E4